MPMSMPVPVTAPTGGQSGAGVAGVASGEDAHPAASAELRFGGDHAEEEPFDELPISGSAVDPEAEAMSTWNESQTSSSRDAVGTALSGGPPHRSQRAELPHWAPGSGPASDWATPSPAHTIQRM